jgi:hypothetical protein
MLVAVPAHDVFESVQQLKVCKGSRHSESHHNLYVAGTGIFKGIRALTTSLWLSSGLVVGCWS